MREAIPEKPLGWVREQGLARVPEQGRNIPTRPPIEQRRRQGALPRAGKEHTTADVAAGADQPDNGRAVLGGLTWAKRAQTGKTSGNTP